MGIIETTDTVYSARLRDTRLPLIDAI